MPSTRRTSGESCTSRGVEPGVPRRASRRRPRYGQGSAFYSNMYVRELSGLPAYTAPFAAVGDAALERAKRVLDAFDAVLILEKLEEHVAQLCVFGWADVRHPGVANARDRVKCSRRVGVISAARCPPRRAFLRYADVMALDAPFRDRLRAANRLDGALFGAARVEIPLPRREAVHRVYARPRVAEGGGAHPKGAGDVPPFAAFVAISVVISRRVI